MVLSKYKKNLTAPLKFWYLCFKIYKLQILSLVTIYSSMRYILEVLTLVFIDIYEEMLVQNGNKPPLSRMCERAFRGHSNNSC